MIKFPSIEQFRNVIRHVQTHARFVGKDENGDAIYDHSKPLPTLKFRGTVTDKDRVEHWAYHHCERENAKWLGTDPTNICPLQGTCPSCREKAFKAILG